MRALIQRVRRASVTVQAKQVGGIEQGLLVLLGITHTDSEKEAESPCPQNAGSADF